MNQHKVIQTFAPHLVLLRDQNIQVLGHVTYYPQGPSVGIPHLSRPFKAVQIIFSVAALSSLTKVCRDYQYTSPRLPILGSSLFIPRKCEWHHLPQTEKTIVSLGKSKNSFHEYLTKSHCLSVFGTTGQILSAYPLKHIL